MQGLIYKGFQSFSGSFDGNGFTLKNFQLSSNVSNARFGKTTGLFGVLTGTVRNLNVENGRFITEKVAEIKGYSQSGNKYAGIIAGLVEQGGKVEYCQVKNSIVRQTLATRENISKDDDRNLIAGGAVGCVGNKGTLDAVVVIDTEVRVKSELLKQTKPKEGLSGGLGQAYAGGLTGALAEGGEITRCSYNQTENFKPASDSTDFKLYAESNNYAVVGGLIGWSEAKSEAQTAYCWVVLADSPTVTGETYALEYGIGHQVNDDVFPLFVYKVWPFTPNDVFQSTISVQVIQDYYAKYGMEQELDLTPFLTTDTDILELHFRTAVDGLVTPPAKLSYAPGEYLDLTGSVVYQSVSRCKLDTPYRYFLPYTMASLKPMFHVYDALQGSVTIGFYYLRSSISSDAAGAISTGTALTVQERPHFFTTKTIKAATCTETGTTRNTCLICGKQETEVTTPALGHKLVVTAPAKAPTCTEHGHTAAEACLRCDYATEGSDIAPLDHTTTLVTVLEPSCVSGGVKQEKCTVCGEVIRLENLAPLGHDYQAAVTAPTCETPGYTTHTCSVCGDSYTDAYTAPTDHHYSDGVVTKKPTCTALGEMTYTCTCGKTHTEPIPVIDHDYAPTVTGPTCTEMGYTTHACTVCGASYVDTYTMAKGHDWDEGETVTPPTLISTGLLRQTCKVCGEKKETVIPSLNSCEGGMDCPSRKFTDVAGIEDWSHIGIDYVIRSCIFYGTSAIEFSPNASMTRAMLASVLYRMDGKASVTGMTHPFEDVAKNAWYEDTLIWAYNNDIISGVSETAFAPNSNVTRQQIAAILYRYAAKRGYDVSASTDLSIFPDSDAVADYAKTAMSWANAAGLVQGSTDGEKTLLLPNDSAIRAQLAAILMRFMKTIAK